MIKSHGGFGGVRAVALAGSSPSCQFVLSTFLMHTYECAMPISHPVVGVFERRCGVSEYNFYYFYYCGCPTAEKEGVQTLALAVMRAHLQDHDNCHCNWMVLGRNRMPNETNMLESLCRQSGCSVIARLS
jgi:hypothetical protein